MIIGCDEVGRGALAGPIVVCAVAFTRPLPLSLVAQLRDSKVMSRTRIAAVRNLLVGERDVAFALHAGSVDQVDRINPLQASLFAAASAAEKLSRRLGGQNTLLMDGNAVPRTTLETICQVKADATVPEVMAASILAKFARDRLMMRMALRWPAYGWTTNVGYGSAAHIAAIRDRGPCPHHRRSFLRHILGAAETTHA